MSKPVAALALACCSFALPAAAQTQLASNSPAGRSARAATLPPAIGAAVRVTSGAPQLDGRLDDAAWQLAPVLSGFTQRDPDEGLPPTESTEVRVAYTDDAMFIAVRAWDGQADRIAAHLTRRDAHSPSDWIAIGIDSYHDRRTAFVFQVNPAGVKRDSYLFDDTNEDMSWDAVWDVAVERDAQGWTAEFRIPFSQLRFARADTHTFGFQVHRVIARRNETQQWRFIPKNAQGNVSLWGELQGIAGLQPPRRLEIAPYTVARGERSRPDAANPFNDGRTLGGNMGADIKFGVTSNLTLDVAINPDFGQVEQDPAYVNLSAFEQFQPERRPFFTEGVNIFRFPILLGDGDGANEQLFYSRRIGRYPQGGADARGGYAEQIQNTTILGAAKLSGRLPSGWNVGLMAAHTSEEEARVRDSLDVPHTDIVEPRSTYLVGRLARDMREGRTVFGVFGTALNRDLPDQMGWLRSNAYAGAVDLNHRFAGDRMRLRGWFAMSHVRGSPEAILNTQLSSARYFQRPDNDHRDVDSAATSLTGFASQLSLGDEHGNWRWSFGYDTRSPEFEVNDAGYMRNADYFQQYLWIGRRWFTPGKVFRRLGVNFNQWQGWNYGRDKMFSGGNINANGQFLNYWGFWSGINRQFGGFNGTELRGGPLITQPGSWNGWYGVYTDQRKTISGEVGGGFFDQDENDSRGAWGYVSAQWRPSAGMQFSFGPNYEESHDDWRYIATVDVGGTRYLLGEMNQHTVSAFLRANLTFTPTLTLQAYVAPFYATVRHSSFKRVADPRAARYPDRFAAVSAQRDAAGSHLLDVDANGSYETNVGNQDFAYTSLRSNVVLRWEYRAGSTIFLVWQQGREMLGSDGAFRMRDVGRSVVGARPDNVFLVKMNYWLSL